VKPDAVLAALLARHDGLVAIESWGETALFHNPGRALPRGVYFATLKQRDGAHDRASRLDRPGVFRLSLGTSRDLFAARFGPPPGRPEKGGVVAGPWDFTALDQCTPHPVYGWMGWVSILNPSVASFEALGPMAEAAHARAVAGFEKRRRLRR
jgi:hypothetical protein